MPLGEWLGYHGYQVRDIIGTSVLTIGRTPRGSPPTLCMLAEYFYPPPPSPIPDHLMTSRGGSSGVKRAAVRKLHQELGIPVGTIAPDRFRFLTRVHYRAPYRPLGHPVWAPGGGGWLSHRKHRSTLNLTIIFQVL